MAKLIAAALVALASSGAASANTLVATEPSVVRASEDPDRRPNLIDARISGLLGGTDVGNSDGFSAGISAGLGYRVGEITLRGLFDYYRVGDGADESLNRNGRATRLGAALRKSFADTSPTSEIALDFWGEAGGGYEHVAWRHGGVLDRPTIELGFGLDFGARNTRGPRPYHREIGGFMALRTNIGMGPEEMGPAMCGGPCDAPTLPSRIDVTMFFELGVQWAR